MESIVFGLIIAWLAIPAFGAWVQALLGIPTGV